MYYEYEKKDNKMRKNNKLNKKVSKYRDKDGHIKEEMQQCVSFVKDIEGNNKIFKFCYNELREENHKLQNMNLKEISREMSHKLKHSFNKNKYSIQKTFKQDGYAIYEKEDIYVFFLVLLESIKCKKVKEFLDIPDVFYILRQIKGVGIDYYFEFA